MKEFYKLRADTLIVKSQDILDLVTKYSTSRCWCYEGQDNPHMHFYLETTTKEATIRQNLRKLGLKGNASYSLKETTELPIEYIAYMMKEGRFESGNLHPDVISAASDYNDTVVKQIKEKKAAKRKAHIVVIQDYLEPTARYIDGQPDITDIYDAILTYHKDNNLLLRKFSCVSMYDTIRLYYSKELTELYDMFA